MMTYVWNLKYTLHTRLCIMKIFGGGGGGEGLLRISRSYAWKLVVKT